MGREIPIRAEIGRESPEPPAARTRDSCAVCGATASGFPPERKVGFLCPSGIRQAGPAGLQAGFPALADGHSLSASPVGAGTVRPTAGNRRFLTIPARIGTPFQPVKGNRESEMTRRCSEHSSRLSPGAVDHICVKPAGTRGHLLHHNIARNKTRRRALSDFALPRHLKRQLHIRRTNPTTTFEALASNSPVDKSARIYLSRHFERQFKIRCVGKSQTYRPVSGFSWPLSGLLEPVEELPSSLSSVVVLVSSLVSDTA